jgi:glycosyltransferase involved in cell wall biosynthesis
MSSPSLGHPEPANRTTGSDSDPVRAVLLPALADGGVHSMSRFAAELQSALAGQSGVSARLAFEGRAPAFGPWMPRRLARGGTRFAWYPAAARRLQGEVFHVLDQGYGHLAAVIDPRRVVVTCHDLIPLRAHVTGAPFRVPATTLAWYRVAVSFLRRVAHVACVSEATRRDVTTLLRVDPARTSVVLSGVSPRFRPLSGTQREQIRGRFPTGSTLLLHVSSGAPYKNVEGTLATLAALRGRGHATLLLRVGPALSTEQRARADRLGVSRYVVERGSVTEEDLIELYNAVDAVIVPSHWEGFGWPVVEALACGAPTVISSREPLLEAAAGAALSAPAEDPAALAAAVERIWEPGPLREELRRRGLERAGSLSWDRTAREYATLYRDVARACENPRDR